MSQRLHMHMAGWLDFQDMLALQGPFDRTNSDVLLRSYPLSQLEAYVPMDERRRHGAWLALHLSHCVENSLQ